MNKETIQKLVASSNLDDVKLGMNLLINLEDKGDYVNNDTKYEKEDLRDFKLHETAEDQWSDYMYVVTKGDISLFLNYRYVSQIKTDSERMKSILRSWKDDEGFEHSIIEE